MKAKKIFAVVMTLVLVLGFNVTSAFATEGVWTIDGLAHVENGDSTNNVSWTNSDSSDDGYSWAFWSKDGSSDGAWISQTVTLEAGTYTLSFIHNGQGENIGSVTLYGFIGDNNGPTEATTGWQEQTLDGQADWEVYSTEITVEAGTYEVGVYADVSVENCWAQVDNISLTDSSGTEYLVMGDFNFDDSDWSTYIVSNVNGSTDDTDSTTDDDDSDSNSNSETTVSSSSSSSSSSTTSTSSTAAKTGDNTPIVMAVVAIVAAAAVVLTRKKKVTE